MVEEVHAASATSNVPPPAPYVRHDASLQLPSSSIDEVRQMMTRSPVKVPLLTETLKGVG